MTKYKIEASVEIEIDTDDDVSQQYLKTVVERNLEEHDIFALGIRTIRSSFNKISVAQIL